jgi:hypothetical protein
MSELSSAKPPSYPIPPLPDDVRQKAVRILKDGWTEAIKASVRQAMEDYGDEWYAGAHFGWGMSVRNYLRNKGISDDQLPTKNWDDYYVEIIQEAVRV